MFTYKFTSDSEAASAICEQITSCLDDQRTLYVKKDSRLSPAIESIVLKKLSENYKIIIFDDLLSLYAQHLTGYSLSFGLEPIFYNFPELISQFELIYCFDGSFCWFASQFNEAFASSLKSKLIIGANLNLPVSLKAFPATRDYIASNSSSQIIPFLDKTHFSITNLSFIDSASQDKKCTLFSVSFTHS